MYNNCTYIITFLYYYESFERISYDFRVETKLQICNIIIIFHTFCNIITLLVIDHYAYDFIGLHQWLLNCGTLYKRDRVVVLRNL